MQFRRVVLRSLPELSTEFNRIIQVFFASSQHSIAKHLSWSLFSNKIKQCRALSPLQKILKKEASSLLLGKVHVSDVSYSVSMSGKNLYFDFFIDMKPRFRFQSEDAVLKFMQFGVDKAL